MKAFFINNWLTILLSVISIGCGYLVAYFFYRLQRRDVISAVAEREKRALEELLDVIESYVINKHTITEAAIYNLLSASERQYQVSLGGICTPTAILQDIALRLQKSGSTQSSRSSPGGICSCTKNTNGNRTAHV